MDIQTTKLELIQQLLAVNKVAVLEAIKEIIISNKDEEIKDKTKQYALSDEQLEEIERRENSYLVGQSKVYSWKEAEKIIISK